MRAHAVLNFEVVNMCGSKLQKGGVFLKLKSQKMSFWSTPIDPLKMWTFIQGAQFSNLSEILIFITFATS